MKHKKVATTIRNFPPLPDFSTLAFGGLLEKNTPIICGGHSNISYETKCYEIGSNEIVAELNTPRQWFFNFLTILPILDILKNQITPTIYCHISF